LKFLTHTMHASHQASPGEVHTELPQDFQRYVNGRLRLRRIAYSDTFVHPKIMASNPEAQLQGDRAYTSLTRFQVPEAFHRGFRTSEILTATGWPLVHAA
jgi:hypothetical protein